MKFGFILSLQLAFVFAADTTARNQSGSYQFQAQKNLSPKSVDEIAKAIKESKGAISIGGARYSQGGQIGIENSLFIDMNQMNKVLEQITSNSRLTRCVGCRKPFMNEFSILHVARPRDFHTILGCKPCARHTRKR